MADDKCSKTAAELSTALALTVKLAASIQEELTEDPTTGRPWALLHHMPSLQLVPVARPPSYNGHAAGGGETGGRGGVNGNGEAGGGRGGGNTGA